MQDVDWDLVQFKYEALGYAEADLAKELNVPETIIRYAASERKWKRLPLEELQERKTEFLLPRYIALETTLLSKTLAAASRLELDKPTTASALKTLVCVLKDLIASNPEMAPEEKEAVHKWEIEIVDASSKPAPTGAEETGPVCHNPQTV